MLDDVGATIMRTSLAILAIIAMALVGMAGATPASNNATIFSNPVVFAGTTTVSGTLTAATLTAANTVSGHLASSLTVDAASAITAAAGADPFDYSLSTSYFYTSTGTNKFNGNVLIGPAATKALTVSGLTTTNTLYVNGTGTQVGVQTFTAAPLFNAGFTAPANQVIDTTTADKLKEAGVIVPTEIAVNVQLGNASNKTIFVADQGWTVTAIKENHDAVGPAGATYSIEKCKSTNPAGTWVATNGVNCMASAGDLTSTINTVATPALNATAGNYAMVAGDRLAIVIGLGHPGQVKGDVTVYLKRV